jgi:hypothetical protein
MIALFDFALFSPSVSWLGMTWYIITDELHKGSGHNLFCGLPLLRYFHNK